MGIFPCRRGSFVGHIGLVGRITGRNKFGEGQGWRDWDGSGEAMSPKFSYHNPERIGRYDDMGSEKREPKAPLAHPVKKRARGTPSAYSPSPFTISKARGPLGKLGGGKRRNHAGLKPSRKTSTLN